MNAHEHTHTHTHTHTHLQVHVLGGLYLLDLLLPELNLGRVRGQELVLPLEVLAQRRNLLQDMSQKQIGRLEPREMLSLH